MDNPLDIGQANIEDTRKRNNSEMYKFTETIAFLVMTIFIKSNSDSLQVRIKCIHIQANIIFVQTAFVDAKTLR